MSGLDFYFPQILPRLFTEKREIQNVLHGSFDKKIKDSKATNKGFGRKTAPDVSII